MIKGMKNRCNNWWICLLLLCISCTENEVGQDVSVNPGEVRMTMNISTRATNDPEMLNVNETRISRIRVYVFDGTTLDKMYYWTLTATNGTYTTPVFTVKAAIGKSLYAVVNEPTDMNTRAILESVDHPNDLIDIQYQMADYLTTKTNVPEYTKDYCLPMYGELNGIDAAEGTTQTINMKVDRAVARVDVYMRKEVGNSEEILTPNVLVVTGVSKAGYIAPAKVGNYASSIINIITRKTVKNIPEETSAEDKGMLAYSFYLPEMECKDRKLNLGFDDYKTIDLGGDSDNSGGKPLEKLERNHVYQLLCRFMTKSVSLDMNILEWVDVEITGDIVGADFDLDKKEISLIENISDPVNLIQVCCNTAGRFQIKVLTPDRAGLMSTDYMQLYTSEVSGSIWQRKEIFTKVTNNNGVYDVTDPQTINFYCTTAGDPTTFEGGFLEISADNVQRELIPIHSLTTFIPLDTEGTANSYIADGGSESYSFKATVMGNGVDGIMDEGDFVDALGNKLTKASGADIHPLSAKLLWQDTDELVEQVALVDGRVQVKMGRSRGNALIAVCDKTDPNAEDANILWSWHLWATPIPKLINYVASRYTGNEYKVMDRNLGATTATPNLGTTEGLHYQWGRKDPFSGSLSNDGKRTVLYNVRSVSSMIKGMLQTQVSIDYAIRTPDIFHTNGIELSWCTRADIRHLWGNPEGDKEVYSKSTVKTIYDPCPIGYKVAPADVFQVLCKGDFMWTSENIESYFYIKDADVYGTTFYCDNAGADDTKTIYLPFTYAPSMAAGDLHKWGYYWNSSLYNQKLNLKYGSMFTFGYNSNYMLPNNISLVTLGNLRCVKE